MRFSDFTQYDIPKPNENANYDSSPFNSNGTLSDDTFSPEDLSSSTPNPSPTPTFQDNSSFNDAGIQPITKMHQPKPSYRTRHHS